MAEREAEELRAELERARRAIDASDELLSFAAHELKGPLHVLGLASHLIEARAGKGEPIEATTLDQIRRQVVRLTRLINQLLDVSRLRQDRLELLIEPLDAAELARAQVKQLAKERAADVSLAGADQPLPIRADRARAGELIGELLENALRSTNAGTRVTVTVAARRGGGAEVTVADAGPGVPEADRATLFDALPHGRSAPRKGPRQGLGLGLHVARAVARLHGGELVYRPGSPGSVFTLTLPA
jgi:signal transduction histidine kinase